MNHFDDLYDQNLNRNQTLPPMKGCFSFSLSHWLMIVANLHIEDDIVFHCFLGHGFDNMVDYLFSVNETRTSQMNKLAKLGDAIAIYKSETINHSLTH